MSWKFDISQIPLVPFSGNPPSDIPDKETAASLKEARLKRHNLLNKLLSDDIRARKIYAFATFVLVALWVAGIFVLLLLQGFLGHCSRTTSGDFMGFHVLISEPSIFSITDSVLMATIGGTTASIIGIFLVVMKNLFPSVSRKD